MSKINDKYYSQQFNIQGGDQTQDLEFHSFFQNEVSNFGNLTHLPSSTMQRQSISPYRELNLTKIEDNEPPLLEELEIYPERIMQKSIAILNPFHNNRDTDYLLNETDLAGPIIFCLLLGVCLFLSGSKVHFGYIYGLSVISVLGMYVLISLMCSRMNHSVSLAAVASALGYGILPIVWLSAFGIFFPLQSMFGTLIAFGLIYLSTAGASRLFCLMIGEPEQRFLIGYPCALIYTVFTLLAVF